ncbi:hypothetical protein FW755_12320 [Lonepinella koalarum]|nr:hypothetical protein [Lonepinella koalarum]MDH2927244.1 hypothetical protein [Lonepinella koalarum]TFJ89512.1 hypothetical protein E0709_09060 [Lonepinella koalarum]TYG33282.1 hypothetical protein FW755_12580 [Lonepinella koalarum]TYG33343.1 hypothetical protein FW755_12320 [Lonepinella koalarum]
MEITFGDKIKINSEEVPEYLLVALYENLKLKFKSDDIVSLGIVHNQHIVSGGTKASSFT